MEIINKWKPILDSLNYNGSNIEQISEYCEQSSQLKNIYLPVSLKILTNLKALELPNCKFTVRSTKLTIRDNTINSIFDENNIKQPRVISEKIKLKIDWTAHVANPTSISELESEITNQAIDNINQKLIAYGDKMIEFSTDNLVEEITMENPSSDDFYMAMKLNYIIVEHD